jgi:hypothetical protein
VGPVFFLGAGASKALGYALTDEVLPLILQRLLASTLFQGISGTADSGPTDRSRFRTQLTTIVPGWEEAFRAVNGVAPDPHALKAIGCGITEVLTLVDYEIANADGTAVEGPSGLASFRELLERAIYEVLADPVTDPTPEQRRTHGVFVEWILSRMGHEGAAVISTNYDVSVDQGLFDAISGRGNEDPCRLVDIGFERRDIGTGAIVPRPADPVGRLFKLHGSLNWLRCPLCGHTYVNTLGKVGALAYVGELDATNLCHCNPWARLRVPIVVPSFVRTIGDRNLRSIWSAAADVLRGSDEWYIVGYSMPPEDVAIRSLLCRAAGHRDGELSIRVIQKGRKGEAIYRALFPSCEYHDQGLAGFLSSRS